MQTSASHDLAVILLDAPEDQLDPSMKKIISGWSNPPTAIQILEVLDHCVNSSLASGLVITALQTLYNTACVKEGVTHEDMVKLAPWRDR